LLADPFLLPNMGALPSPRWLRAGEQDEPLVIFGDLRCGRRDFHRAAHRSSALARLAREFYLPNRMDEGYGLSADGVKNCLKNSRRRFCSPWTAARLRLKQSNRLPCAALM